MSKVKLSFAISMQQTAFKAVGLGDWLESAGFMSSLSYNGIELAIRNPFKVNPKNLRRELAELGLTLSAIGTGQAFFDEGVSLTASRPYLRKKATALMKRHFELGGELNAVVIVGLIRGKLSETVKMEGMDQFREAMQHLDENAGSAGTVMAIEPINRYETNFLNTAEETVKFIKTSKLKHTGVLLDTFHMNIEEATYAEAIRVTGKYLFHVHLADSNRRYPGAGHLDFDHLMGLFHSAGYRGYYSGEMLPSPDLNSAISRFSNFMERYK